jgi:energy-coupling factor transporter ATP-binding protein EcfA2
MPSLAEVAEILETLGYNIVPVGGDKRPIGTWSAKEKIYSAEDVKKLGNKVGAIAITGNWYANPEYATLILDVDNPNEADKILNDVFRDWRRYLCTGPDAFCGLTGPRPKHKVKCRNDECVNIETGEVIPLEKVERGVYVVVRVSRSCVSEFTTARKGVVELIYSNYQVVYGQHPYGVKYAFAVWDGERWRHVGRPGYGVILTCEEFRKLLRRLGLSETGQKIAGTGESVVTTCKELRKIADPELLLDTLKILWPARREDGSHYHDEILYALVGTAYRRCIDGEQLKQVLTQLFEWAKQQGLDNDKTIDEHWRQTFNYIYGDRAQKVWGLTKLEEVVNKVCRALGMSEQESTAILDDILSALGISTHNEFNRPVCVVIRSKRTTKDKKVVSRPTVRLCNTREGIIKVEKKESRKNVQQAENGGPVYSVSKVVNAYIKELVIYRDAELDIEYVSAKIEIPGADIEETLSMARPNALERLLSRRKVSVSPNWEVLIDYYPRRVDYIVSGFVCSPYVDKYPCDIRDYFDTGVATETSPEEARKALEDLLDVLAKYQPSERWYRIATAAYFHGAFQNFFFTHKLWRVRPQVVAFIGPRGTGKSTIALTLLHTFFPRVTHKLFRGAASVLTPARVGRLQDDVVATLTVLDEVERVSRKEDVYAVLKSYISNPSAWKTATGEEWPARAGLILTANAFTVEDPELADKIYVIQFRDLPDLDRRSMFARELLSVSQNLVKFGAFYLRYAEEHWQDVKETILDPDMRRGAEEYAKIIADVLGVSIDVEKPQESALVVLSATDRYISWLYNYLVRYSGPLRDTNSYAAWRLLDIAIEKNLLPHHRSTLDNRIIISKSIQAEINVNIRTLCEELGGEVITSDTHKTLYGACIVDKDKILDILAEVKTHHVDEEER